MDKQVESSILDIDESFKALGKLKDPLITLDKDHLNYLKEFHKTRIKLNIKALLESEELQ